MRSKWMGIFLGIAVIGSAVAAQFDEDVAFLKKHTKVLVISDAEGRGQVAVIPAWQGRVMTSTDAGAKGASYGWINREMIAAGKVLMHFNPYGGEDRLWLGPEGGQFSIFFAKGAAFDLDHWQTPAAFDTEPFEVASQSRDRVAFRRHFQMVNYSGTRFDVELNREVRMMTAADSWKALAVKPAAGVSIVSYESVNRLTNAGTAQWSPRTGLLSIWILGMYNAAPETTIVVPIREGTEAKLGPRVNADYFGKVPANRLVADEKAVFFRGDGKYRSKIGISPRRAMPVLGSYDAKGGVLTLVQYTLPQNATRYVNSQWKLQADPFSGDVINSYNDDGKMGAFYEMESSSPAAELAPGKTVEHVHRTIHLRGSEAALDAVARATLGVSLERIKTALPR
jgi:hypothetical protein